MKTKQVSRASQAQNLLQLLKNQIDFLSIFTLNQLQYLKDNHEIIVFKRGNIIVKQKQVIDFIGILLNGGAITQMSKKKLTKGSLVGSASIINLNQIKKHPESIIADSDGIIFCIRVQRLIQVSKSQQQSLIKSKIINFLSQQNLSDLKQVLNMKIQLQKQFQVISDQKAIAKYHHSNKILSCLLQTISSFVDIKQKQSFLQFFPLFYVKQKTLIRSKNHISSFFIIVFKGELIVKYGRNKREQKIIDQNSGVYNAEGFVFDHHQHANIYALTSQVVFMLVQKNILNNNAKIMTQAAVLKFCIEQQIKANDYTPLNSKKSSQQQQLLLNHKQQQLWSPFKKPYSIQQLPQKALKKPLTAQTKKKQSISNLQTLYLTYSSSSSPNKKIKTKQSTLFTQPNDDGGFRLATIKTEHSIDNNKQNIRKMQSQLHLLKEQIKALTQQTKSLKLDLLETKTRLKYVHVFKQITQLASSNNGIIKQTQIDESQSEGKTVTLKQAFQKHLKNQKIQILVAKCAYKWLDLTRRNRHKRQQQSQQLLSSSSILKH